MRQRLVVVDTKDIVVISVEYRPHSGRAGRLAIAYMILNLLVSYYLLLWHMTKLSLFLLLSIKYHVIMFLDVCACVNRGALGT